MMKRFSMMLVVVAAASMAFAGAALAQMGYGGMGRGMWGGGMGPGMMGAGLAGTCPGAAAVDQTSATQITEEQAKVLVQQYADQYLKGFTVERVLPFTGRLGTMYSVELKGPDGQVRAFHVNPWGNVMPFGGPTRRAG
ncbi:MAG TPA: PepSY domain-containing protein [Methylomirabilota bacterium]|nr:PepSY domain-containing protein [Methylomirabilota bacterium]